MRFGVGDRYWWETTSGQYATTPQLLAQNGFPANNQLLGIWLPAGWQPSWFAGIQSDMDQGDVPVFIHYTLGDLAQYGNSAWSYVQSQQQAWLADVSRLAQALAPLKGTVLVVLQPEFNVPSVEDQPGFGQMLAQGAQILHAAQTPQLRILVGACPGDFGVYAGTTVDTVNWDAFKPALTPALGSLDFLAFQEMRGQIFDGAQQTPDQQGLSLLPARTLAFAQYLQATYGKPLLLAYMTVATFNSPSDPLGWDALAAQATAGVLAEAGQLHSAGLFGIMAMSLFDDLSHNNDGKDAWGEASRYFGLIASNGTIGQAALGAPPYTIKQVGKAWIQGTAAWK